ncbi:TrmB family transcriptional regulator [Haladaptatus caseinilyticus]|uniref:TrmB family transcriptional regulator n=1 Tax=Haladaptatus caseinilyticus TaxID=2993314 RepID=UPI00224AC615|nr:TrmB family transcriptional regulator sugar-binding domain-containing protein [Haladaptatus caseinilyticus]
MDDRTLSDLLRQFGLSEKEVDTYLAILDQGEAKASTVADDAGVSKRYVYSTSEKLAERGFVEVNDHVVPTMIRANPPEQVIGTLADRVETMRPALDERYSATASDPDQFEVIKSRVTVIKRIENRLADASEEITLSIPYEHLPEVANELGAAVERGVLVLLVVSGVHQDTIDESEFEGIASAARAWREPMPTTLTVDQRFGLVAPTEMILRSNSDKQAITFAQEQLVPVLVGSFLGNYWPMANEVYTTAPTELPQTFQDFRHAVLQATLHLRANHPVHARVRAHPVGSENGQVTVDGKIVDIRQGLIEPASNAFPVETALVLNTENGEKSIGGSGSFIEDFEAETVSLELVR